MDFCLPLLLASVPWITVLLALAGAATDLAEQEAPSLPPSSAEQAVL
ncbi:hypothetical protein [Rhodoferax koreensis]|nr:hypothetical protein [Rhodoferax koreense]